MGGIKCSYKNCQAKSGENVHIFHYPVFDKIRCHQWLTNAQKLNFLDLKVYQLKNRVVCMHHFKDDDFMNYKKNKLKNTAIPTEDGPLCKPDNSKAHINNPVCSITVDDIENDYMTLGERRANFSTRYGEFLTNDVTNSITLEPSNKNDKLNTCFNTDYDNVYLNKYFSLKDINGDKNKLQLSYFDRTTTKNNNNSNIRKVSSGISKSNISKIVVPMELEKHNIFSNSQTQSDGKIVKEKESTKTDSQLSNVSNSKPESLLKPTKNKVTIISEKKISDPIQVQGKLELIAPTINLRDRSRRKLVGNTSNLSNSSSIKTINTSLDSSQGTQSNSLLPQVMECTPNISCGQQSLTDNSNIVVQNIELIEPTNEKSGGHHSGIKIQFEDTDPSIIEMLDASKNDNLSQPLMNSLPFKNDSNNLSTQNNTEDNNKPTGVEKTPLSRSSVKSKMPISKVKAIDQKRKFNKRLGDIIFYANHCDDQPQIVTNPLGPISNQEKSAGDNLTSSATEPDLPNSQENLYSYLEARFQKLEASLCSKIENNTQKIYDLKKIMKPTGIFKSAYTQTLHSEETIKKMLYNEICKYLDPETNSSVYEQLFVNKYSEPSISGKTSHKRRKR